jgi:hypothetical protein
VWDTFPDTWTATDALGRTLIGHEQAGPPRPDKFVGAFYFLWNGASVLMAAHCTPDLDPARFAALAEFGAAVGLAFQVQDDILDVEGDAALTGRPTGSDQARAMPTYPAVAGLESARTRVADLHRHAARQLDEHGWTDGPLAALADWLLARRR